MSKNAQMLCHICEKLIDVSSLIRLLPCFHIFCMNCVDAWKKISNVSVLCYVFYFLFLK